VVEIFADDIRDQKRGVNMIKYENIDDVGNLISPNEGL